MKDKIMLFIIGVLVGAVLATGAFYAYSKINSSNNNQPSMNGGTPPSMPSGENGKPPELPSGENNQGGQPPEMPNSNNSQNNSESNSN